MKRFSFENTIAGGTSILTVVAPKFCCWGSAVAALSSGVSYLAWVNPMKPYLIAVALLSLGYSHYKAYKTDSKNCATCKQQKTGFFQSKTYLWLVTFAIICLFTISYLQQ